MEQKKRDDNDDNDSDGFFDDQSEDYDPEADTKEYDGYDRTHFCFYALAYMAHKLWILYTTESDLVITHYVSPYNNIIWRLVYECIGETKIFRWYKV